MAKAKMAKTSNIKLIPIQPIKRKWLQIPIVGETPVLTAQAIC